MDGQHTQEAATRRRHYYIGAALGAVILILLVILILIVVALVNNGHSQCKLSRTIPDMAKMLSEKKNVASPDYSGLANMVGYLHFYDKGFMPVMLSEFTFTGALMKLTSDCATLSWSYSITHEPDMVNLSYLNLELPDVELSNGLNGTRKICNVPLMSYGFYLENRFSCRSRTVSVCRLDNGAHKGYGIPIGELVLESFEFELQGDASKIRRGEFSKQPDENNQRSCSNFDV